MGGIHSRRSYIYVPNRNHVDDPKNGISSGNNPNVDYGWHKRLKWIATSLPLGLRGFICKRRWIYTCGAWMDMSCKRWMKTSLFRCHFSATLSWRGLFSSSLSPSIILWRAWWLRQNDAFFFFLKPWLYLFTLTTRHVRTYPPANARLWETHFTESFLEWFSKQQLPWHLEGSVLSQGMAKWDRLCRSRLSVVGDPMYSKQNNIYIRI